MLMKRDEIEAQNFCVRLRSNENFGFRAKLECPFMGTGTV